MNTPSRTVQLRRYQFPVGDLTQFVPWWTEVVPPLRAQFGFHVEWAYSLPATDEFLWAVSFIGSEQEFLAAEQAYMDSPEREATFANVPVPPPAYDNRFIDVVIS